MTDHASSLLITLQLWHDSTSYVEYTFDPNGPDPSDCPHVHGPAVATAFEHTPDQFADHQKTIAKWMQEGERLNSYHPIGIEETFIKMGPIFLKANGKLKMDVTLGMRDETSGDLLADPPPLEYSATWDPAGGDGSGGLITSAPYAEFKISYPAFQKFKDEIDKFITMTRIVPGS